MSNKTIITLLVIVLGLAVIGGIYASFTLMEKQKVSVDENGTLTEGKSDNEVEPQNITLRVFFLDSKDPRSETDCAVTRVVTRTVSVTPRVADTALRELFKGPTTAEQSAGLATAFTPNANTGEATQMLGEYYLGVSIKNETAIVNFSRLALGYLNSPACLQVAVKAPIIDTLKQFSTVKKVEFAIDGEIYTEWDA